MSDQKHGFQKQILIPGYQIKQILYQSQKSIIYQGIRELDQVYVLFKLPFSEYPAFSSLVGLKNHHTLTQGLEIAGVVSSLELLTYDRSLILVMPDEGLVSLKEYTAGQAIALENFFPIAIALASLIEELHQAHIIHKDINPSHILLHPQTKQVKLTDFSLATLLPQEKKSLQPPNQLEGNLNYLSPEQTGRMNRGIDYRSDFYSLGVTFYELLTGQLPFVTDDPMRLIYAHLTQIPKPPHHLNRDLPEMLSEVVLKLMAKTAEDRYQSAIALRYDLEQCHQQWQQEGYITPFPIAQKDLASRFLIPEKLYGREVEINALLTSFERVSQGSREIILVAGFSGIGKTAVVNEVHKPITQKRAYFIKGKFDQLERNLPFSGFVQALRSLIKQLLTESEDQLQQWRDKILDALGEQGQVMIDLLPELEILLGQQSVVAELSGTAAQNRFNLLLQKFIQVFATVEHPLVIFLDDLQWADVASLKLVQLLMEDTDTHYLLIIGAYRDNEIFPGHPTLLTLEAIQKAQTPVQTITLPPLSWLEINHLVADTLKCDSALAYPLTELIFQKTQGNPFFATQFLKALYNEKLIYYVQEDYWQCDLTQVKRLALKDDIVELITLQLQKLPPETQDILKLAACIGNEFDLETLEMISEKSLNDLADILWPALQKGYILPKNEIYKFFTKELLKTDLSIIPDHCTVNYKFLHDRVQQAAYLLIPENQKLKMHLKIGKLLLKNTSAKAKEERFFEIINHLNYGIPLITEQAPRNKLANYNLQAGLKAKASTAYIAAVRYCRIGRELLDKDSWKNNYHLTLALYELETEMAYLSGDLEQMEQLIEVVLQQATNVLDQMRVYEIRIQAYITQRRFDEAVSIALVALKLLNIELPRTASQLKIQEILKKTAQKLNGIEIADLANLPEMTSPQGLAATKLLVRTAPAAYINNPELLPFVICESINLFIEQGNNALSAYMYAWYGVILCGLENDIATGYQFGELALCLLDQFDSPEIRARTRFIDAYFLQHWQNHARNCVFSFLVGYQDSLEQGDLECASWLAMGYCFYSFFAGFELVELENKLAIYREISLKFKQQAAANYIEMTEQTVSNLLYSSEYPCLIEGEKYRESQGIPLMLAAHDLPGLNWVYLNKMMLCYLLGEYQQAIENAQLTYQYAQGGMASLRMPLLNFYDSLSRLAIASGMGDDHLEQVAANQAQLKQWAEFAPMNHLHKYYLVEAERCRVLGDKVAAMEYYDQAIAGARDNGYLQEEALANEIAFRFYLAWGREKIAQTYFTEAYYVYSCWGAQTKLRDLEKRYPQFLPSSKLTPSITSQELDWKSAITSAHIIAQEVNLTDLIVTSLQVIMENAGATKGVLLLSQDNQLVIEASIPQTSELPQTVIHYVAHTQETVIFNQNHPDARFSLDSYLIKEQPQSLLCLPLLKQRQLMGLLYLENQVMSGAFSGDRLELLQLLSTQVAISIENARLYQQMEQRIQQRTEELAKSEERYRLLSEMSPVGIYRHDQHGQCTYANEETIQITGLSLEQLLGDHWQKCICPEDLQDVLKTWSSFLEQAKQDQDIKTNIEFRFLHPDGQVVWVLAQTRPERNALGEITGYIGTIIDISSRKQAEAQLAVQNNLLARIAQREPLSDILNTLIELLEQQLQGSIGSILLLDQENCLRHGSAPNLPESYIKAIDGISIGEKTGSCGTAAFRKEKVIVADIDHDPLWQNFRELAQAHHLKACWSFPLIAQDGHVLGTFAIYYRTQRTPQQMDLAVIASATHLAGIAIERQQMDDLLESNQILVQSIATASPGILYIYDVVHQRNLFSNRDFWELIGYSTDEIQDMGSQWLAQILHPNDLESVFQHQNAIRTSADGVILDLEYRILHKNGQWIWVQSLDTPFKRDQTGQITQYIGTALDVTRRKEAEIALQQLNEELEERVQQRTEQLYQQTHLLQTTLDHLKESENRFRLASECASDLIYEWDILNGQLEWYSDIDHHLGYETGEFPRTLEAWEQSLHPEDRERVLIAIEQHLESPELFCAEYRIRCKNGTYLYWIDRGIMLRDQYNRPYKWIGVNTDITERKQAETALYQLNAELENRVQTRTAQLQEAKEAAESANRAKSLFLANMSHELRTPLNAILGFSQLLARQSSLTSIQRQQINTINRSGEHLLNLINDILAMSKIEAGRITLDSNCFDLDDQLNALEQMFCLKAYSKGLELRFQKGPNLPAFICTDQGKLRQILINLLSNAIKFTETGSVTLKVSITDNLEGLIFDIIDTGIGIAADDLTRLFEPFVQGQNHLYEQEGTGLGLTITQQFIALMQGTLICCSTVGEGTTFHVTIPVEVPISEQNIQQSSQRRIQAIAPGQPDWRILVVEDIDYNRLLLVQLLREIGFSVQEAINGQEAIQMWQEWQPHLIWMDIRLPDFSGLEVTQQIRATEQTTKIIALTANSFAEEKNAALEAGCDDFVPKPFADNALLEKMAQHLPIQYIYEDENSVDALIPEKLTSSSLSFMSNTWLEQFYQNAMQLDSRKLLFLLEEIPADFIEIRKRLHTEIEEFNFEFLLTLCEID